MDIRRNVTRNLLIGMAAWYAVGVGICGILKLNVPLCSSIPWPEVFYGPAITVASTVSLILCVAWICDRTER
jgi:hypothetical protein